MQRLGACGQYKPVIGDLQSGPVNLSYGHPFGFLDIPASFEQPYVSVI